MRQLSDSGIIIKEPFESKGLKKNKKNMGKTKVMVLQKKAFPKAMLTHVGSAA